MSLASRFSAQGALFDPAACQHCGLCHYELIELASLFLNTVTSLTSFEFILLHSSHVSSEAAVLLPLFQSGYFLDSSKFQIALDQSITFLSTGNLDLNLPSSFTYLLPSILFNDFFVWQLCIYKEREGISLTIAEYYLHDSSLGFLDVA